MLNFVCIILLITLAAAWSRIVLDKFGILEWLEINLPGKLSELVSCSFCSAFWFATIIGVGVFCINSTHPLEYIGIGIFVAPLARLLA